MNSPASVATVTERKSSHPAAHTSAMDSVPTRAAEKRQPSGSSAPKSHMPNAMSHFPAGGCTT